VNVTAYVALGSNLDDPDMQLQRAVDEIDSTPDIRVTGCSRLYRSDPVGPEGQPDYCNAVVEIETALPSLELLDALQAIEQQHGRERSLRWGPRTLDLDILLYSNDKIQTARLTVPHYQMHVRNFVLCPLADIVPELRLPDGQALSHLVEENGQEGLSVIANEYPWI